MTPVECHNCGYEWAYSGDLGHETCPNCSRKTKVDADNEGL